MDAWTGDIVRAVGVRTAPAHEAAAVEFVKDWARARPWAQVRLDLTGNVQVRPVREHKGNPIYLCAHLDHPGFVVEHLRGPAAELLWRGTVGGGIAPRTGVVTARGVPGVLGEVLDATPGSVRLAADFDGPLSVGEVVGFDVGPGRVEDASVLGPACDDMAGVAVCLGVLEALRESRDAPCLRVLLTRAEEIGMLGAIGACRAAVLGECARVLCVDAREASAGGGIAVAPGGAKALERALLDRGAFLHHDAPIDRTEAGVFAAFGHEAAAVLFPVQGVHNISADGVCAERVAIDDLAALRRVLVDSVCAAPRKTRRGEYSDHWDKWSSVLG
ncbi:MAG: hypothetical protein ACOYN0_00780 [Phycisphaerales bacterium]